jgi:hypothetical protein
MIFEILSDDILQSILNEWIAHILPLAPLDRALGCRSLRDRYLAIPKRFWERQHLDMYSEEIIESFVHYKSTRNIFCSEVDINMSWEAFVVLESIEQNLQEVTTLVLNLTVDARLTYCAYDKLCRLLSILPSLQSFKIFCRSNEPPPTNDSLSAIRDDILPLRLLSLRHLEFYYHPTLFRHDLNPFLHWLAQHGTKLESLHIHTTDPLYRVMQYAIPILQSFPSLIALHFTEEETDTLAFDDDVYQPPIFHLNRGVENAMEFPRFTSFHVYSLVTCDGETIEEIEEIVNSCPNLTDIALPCEVVQLIPSFSRVFPQLLQLELYGLYYSVIDFTSAKPIEYCSTTLMTLTICGIDDFYDTALLSIAQYCKQLHKLTLQSLSFLTDTGIESFCEVKRSQYNHLNRRHESGNQLTKVSILFCDLTAESLRAILDGLANQLTHFSWFAGFHKRFDNISAYHYIRNFFQSGVNESCVLQSMILHGAYQSDYSLGEAREAAEMHDSIVQTVSMFPSLKLLQLSYFCLHISFLDLIADVCPQLKTISLPECTYVMEGNNEVIAKPSISEIYLQQKEDFAVLIREAKQMSSDENGMENIHRENYSAEDYKDDDRFSY